MFPVIMVLIVIAGLIGGWFSIPHYKAPPAADEARLRERAAEFYQATRLFDFQAMTRMYSPARQISDSEALIEEAAEKAPMFGQLDEKSQESLIFSAESITAGELEVELDGDWASTKGFCSYPVDGNNIQLELEELIWIRTGGDWWIYTWKWPEIAAYGNPSLEAMELLRKRKIDELKRLGAEYQREQLEQQQRQAPPTESDGEQLETDNTSVDESGDEALDATAGNADGT